MNTKEYIDIYIKHCEDIKKLSSKTIKAYKIDLYQFNDSVQSISNLIDKNIILEYITLLNRNFKSKSVKRKIASLKAYLTFLENEEIIQFNPLTRLKIKIKEPFKLPRTINTESLTKILSYPYQQLNKSDLTDNQKKILIRDIAVLELLFGTGLRISELCNLTVDNVNLSREIIQIKGKGNKERIIPIPNKNVTNALKQYKSQYVLSSYFFINRLNQKLSDQSVRFMINKYCNLTNIQEHITPHMFRHTFATLLLEEDVDIRYIQHILGHSSITTTQIYTHVTSNKQKEILTYKHPRDKLNTYKG